MSFNTNGYLIHIPTSERANEKVHVFYNKSRKNRV